MTVKKTALLAAMSLAVAGCASNEERAVKIMDASLGGQSGIYEDLQEYPGDVVCGQSTTAGFSGAIERQFFIVKAGVANTTPSQLDRKIYCSADPAAAVAAELGIDYATQRDTVLKILADFDSIEAAIAEYDRDNGYCPSTEQGLEALVTPATVGNTPRNFPEGGYLSALPKDPWGNDYAYDCPPFAGVKSEYRLSSLGADGEAGGEGPAADVKAAYRGYFEHLDSL